MEAVLALSGMAVLLVNVQRSSFGVKSGVGQVRTCDNKSVPGKER